PGATPLPTGTPQPLPPVIEQRQATPHLIRETAPSPHELPLFGESEITAYSQKKARISSKCKVTPHFVVTAVYDDNIFVTSQNKKSDFTFTLAPGVAVRLGTDESALSIIADYTAGFTFFTKDSGNDSVDQAA